MTRKGRAITLSLSEQDKIALQTIAVQLDCTWGDKPNISKLVEEIAQGKLLIAANHDWSADLIGTLYRAMVCLSDRGDSKNAQTIAALLLKRSELEKPLRREIERFLEIAQKPNWRIHLDRFIDQNQSFQLAYQDAAQRIWSFHIQFADIVHRDRREYLDCWCQETKGNTDLPELQHNWSLRLDRIADASLAPISSPWREQLDQLRVEFHLYHGLAFAYEAKLGDIYSDWLPNQPQVRRVLRDVTSTFWLLRDLLPYGEDCIVVSPPKVRQRFKNTFTALYHQYNTES
jgi:hypothetical protein